jgi:hypothetical protein
MLWVDLTLMADVQGRGFARAVLDSDRVYVALATLFCALCFATGIFVFTGTLAHTPTWIGILLLALVPGTVFTTRHHLHLRRRLRERRTETQSRT